MEKFPELKSDNIIGIVVKELETSWDIGVCLCAIYTSPWM